MHASKMPKKINKNLQFMLYVAKKCNSRPGCTSWHHRMATKTRHEEEMPSGSSEPAVCRARPLQMNDGA